MGGPAPCQEFRPPNRFVDALASDGPTSWPPRLIGRWRHIHEFSDAGNGTTLVHDTVETPVPAAVLKVLKPMFVYRHRQLADDLAAHRDAAERAAQPLVVAVTGASGLIGRALTAFLTAGGHQVIRLVRQPTDVTNERQWDTEAPAADLLSGVDAVIHLAGTSIAGRFTDAHKSAIRDSRIGPSRRLAEQPCEPRTACRPS